MRELEPRQGGIVVRIRMTIFAVLAVQLAVAGSLAAQLRASAADVGLSPSVRVGWSTEPRWLQVYDGATGTDQLVRRVLTQDGADTYAVVKAGATVTASAPASNTSWNQRELFWPAGMADRLNGRSCASLVSESQPGVQQGVALRIVTGPASTRAVTVTKNVFAGVVWVFNVHVWDSSLAEPFIGIGQFDLSAVLSSASGGLHALPWQLCAQVYQDRLTLKLWVPAVHPEPSWTDPVHTRTTTVPAAWNVAGQHGWYVGHLPPGGSATYGTLRLWHN